MEIIKIIDNIGISDLLMNTNYLNQFRIKIPKQNKKLRAKKQLCLDRF